MFESSALLKYLALLSFGEGGWGAQLLSGAFVTISVALATLPFGLALGLLVALGQRAQNGAMRRMAVLFTTIFRGVPELLTLYIVYFGAQIALQKSWAALGFVGRFEFSPFVAGVVALALVLGAFSAEVWVGALNSVHKGQREAATALGLTPGQAFRLVIVPQILRVALPGLGNNWLVLLKDTSLVSVITLQDTMFVATRANVVTKEPFLFFSAAAFVYLFFSILSALVFAAAERRAGRGFFPQGRR